MTSVEPVTNMPRRFESTVAVVTGAGSGVGRATAERLALEGARVACLDVDVAAASETAAAIEAAPSVARAYACDVAREPQVAAALRDAERDLGAIGVIVANAGIAGPVGPVTEIGVEDWERVIAVNLTGVFLCAKHGIPALRRNGGGTLVVTSSNAAINAEPGWTAYGATKGGVLALTRCLGIDHRDENIRVNCVCPGAIDTPLLRRGYAETLGEDVVADMSRPLPVPTGRPSDVAAIIAFLASGDSALINAVGVVADGGSTSLMGGGFGGQVATPALTHPDWRD